MLTILLRKIEIIIDAKNILLTSALREQNSGSIDVAKMATWAFEWARHEFGHEHSLSIFVELA